MIEDDNPRYLSNSLVPRIRNILTALLLAENVQGFLMSCPPGWRSHRLSGERETDWSVSVSGNWRITFRETDGYIDRLNLEDYH